MNKIIITVLSVFSVIQLSIGNEYIAPLALKNSENSDRDVVYSRGTYLIIAANDNIVSYLSNESLGGDFIHFKQTQGYDVEIWTIEEGMDGDALRLEIFNYYESNPMLEYVLLIGDVNAVGYTIPTFTVPSINEPEMDVTDYKYTYSPDDGNPFSPNFFLGRWSIRSLSELWKIKAKSIQYVRMDNIDDFSYLNTGLLVAGNFSGDEVPPNQWPVTPVWTSKWLQDKLYDKGFDQVDTVFFHQENYQEGDVNPLIANAWNSGVGIINYRGWADANGWHKPYFHKEEVSDLFNGWKLPIVFSFVCNTGDFGNDHGVIGLPQCFGEVMTIEGVSFNNPRGAAAMIGPSDLDTDTKYNNVICGAMWDNLLEETAFELAPALHSGKQALLVEFPDDEYSVEFYHHVYGTIGDPSIPVWIGEPKHLNSSLDENTELTESYIQTIISDENGDPLKDVVGALLYGGNLISKGLSNSEGLLSIDFEGVNIGESLELYLNKPRYFQKQLSLTFSTDDGSAFEPPIQMEFEVLPAVLSDSEYAVSNEPFDLGVNLINLSPETYDNVVISLAEISNGISGDIQMDQVITINPFSSITTESLFTGTVNSLSKGSSLEFVVSVLIDGEGIGEYPISVLVGPLTTSDPIPPDNYGYWTYDHTDTDYDEHPVYEWVELNPQDGGNGTDLLLVDDTLTEVDLGFTFTYYGNDYTSMTVGSNGWISFEPEAIPYFWNFSIPMPMGPSAMIAPYFDDLDDNLGEEEFNVFYWYDEDQGRIIVQWDNVANGEDDEECPDCVRETFELILYDPSVHPTITGDGEIVFQYQEINDIDANGNYSTIGIESPDQNDGVQVLFSGNHHVSAAPLIDGVGELAIKFTTDAPGNVLSIGSSDKPAEFQLLKSYPNPFNPTATILYEVASPQNITLDVFNLLGQKVANLENQYRTAGVYEFEWDGSELSSGMYIVRLKYADGFATTTRLTLLK